MESAKYAIRLQIGEFTYLYVDGKLKGCWFPGRLRKLEDVDFGFVEDLCGCDIAYIISPCDHELEIEEFNAVCGDLAALVAALEANVPHLRKRDREPMLLFVSNMRALMEGKDCQVWREKLSDDTPVFVACNKYLDIASQGSSPKEARENLMEAVGAHQAVRRMPLCRSQ